MIGNTMWRYFPLRLIVDYHHEMKYNVEIFSIKIKFRCNALLIYLTYSYELHHKIK